MAVSSSPYPTHPSPQVKPRPLFEKWWGVYFLKYPEIYCNLLIQIVALAGLGAMNLHRSLEARICFRSGIFYILSRCKVLGDEISKIGYQECNTERAIAMTTLTWERAELIFTLRTIGEVIENTKDTGFKGICLRYGNRSRTRL